jgi:tRNA-specific 2-thiouridylase
MKVLVGMSGGVDSSLAAHLLKEEGYEVEGLSLVLFETRGEKGPRACCTLEALGDAAGTAERLGIGHGTLDLRNEFIEKVVGPFVDAYMRGYTPNPCILCNRHIKFPALLREARKRGSEFIATGHYARVDRSGGGEVLKTGVDPRKDQSYVLYALRPEELGALVLPLGSYTKEAVRKKARELGLPAARREESQEICFVEGRDYPGFIAALTGEEEKPGPIIDAEGRTLGSHRGIHRYTVGQRRGLGISSPEPLYVTGVDAEKNTVFVGPREAAMVREFAVGGVNWLQEPGGEFRAGVKVRSTMKAKPALVRPLAEDRAHVRFDEPQWAPSPGQAAVFYLADSVAGGGTIEVRTRYGNL